MNDLRYIRVFPLLSLSLSYFFFRIDFVRPSIVLRWIHISPVMAGAQQLCYVAWVSAANFYSFRFFSSAFFVNSIDVDSEQVHQWWYTISQQTRKKITSATHYFNGTQHIVFRLWPDLSMDWFEIIFYLVFSSIDAALRQFMYYVS